ncbi:HNH endonuclease [Methylotenera mobilis]|uniref:HNH endonuclease n=1 Tax=Methylotenera mobilis (strain JLW8 / ATCC BAA-1282 / DSM 17540) TaxID=583345 RepID=C6WXV3_METML|nr:HNH endonuclease [Methylotenera mobilis]ACT48752.1 HNH endonuclease [Methylotenera mobilis JLW8]
MARTHGHGNPKWTRDETILALDLYFDLNGKIPSGSDDRVKALSEVLRRFPHHAEASRKESFRNPVGVAFKLQNLRQVATGKGLGNVSETDRAVWLEFGVSAAATKSLANLIRAGVTAFEASEPVQEDVVFAEGRVITELHTRREREPKLRGQLLSSRRVSGNLFCEMCGAPPHTSNAMLQEAHFEAHHIIPLSNTGVRKTRLSDLALLCANCHRLLHRAIAIKKRWLTVAEGKVICGV